MDLFIGGRVIAGKYPAPASSQLYYNIDGKFKPDISNSEKLKNIGLVSGAVFSDIDNDGDSDIILALEWGPIQIFQNEDGKFTDTTERFGLDLYRGWWNGVTTGDFDEDAAVGVVVGFGHRFSIHRKAAGMILQPVEVLRKGNPGSETGRTIVRAALQFPIEGKVPVLPPAEGIADGYRAPASSKGELTTRAG